MTASAMDRVDVLRAARDAAGSMLVGLDFDGTLAPIVPHYQDAELIPAARQAITALAGRDDTRVAIVSGRAISDLRSRVPINDVWFAGNHGLEIDGPDARRVEEAALDARDTLHQLARDLSAELAAIPGVIVEDKGLTLSVHFRLVADEAAAEHVRSIVHARAVGSHGVRLTDGRKVVEIRPDVDWHKGRAFEFIRATIEDRFGLGPAIFVGDDRTDEDAFRTLGDTDCAVVVGDPPGHASIARVALRSPSEVAEFLRLLAAGD